ATPNQRARYAPTVPARRLDVRRARDGCRAAMEASAACTATMPMPRAKMTIADIRDATAGSSGPGMVHLLPYVDHHILRRWGRPIGSPRQARRLRRGAGHSAEDSSTLYDHHHVVTRRVMPWPDDHKIRTREKIVQAAADAFRAGGVANVRLEDVMARAGLTHGGFYAHFSSKEQLLREAGKRAGDQTLEMLSQRLSATPDDGRLQAVIDAYLSPAHIAHPERGCPLATLGPELARTPGATQGVLAEGVRNRLAWMRGLVAKGQRTAS